jgi:hypothetical protein
VLNIGQPQPTADIGKAIVCFQNVERVKSELIIAARLVEYVIELKGDEQNGASKLFRWYLESLLGEINIAHNIVGRDDFQTAGEKVTAAIEKAKEGLFEETIRLISEGISAVASSGQWSMQILKDGGFL